MMVTTEHYDDDTLMRLLRQRVGKREELAMSHVESCAKCQDKLELLTQSGMTWEEVSELLRPGLDDGTDFSLASGDPPESVAQSGLLQPSDHPESLGRFARYEIMEMLGRGGMGIVMRAYDTSLNRHSAIKVLAPELASSAAARKRFSREAKSAAAVVHPHVVPIQTVDQHNGLPYLVMPVVEGQSLQQRVDTDGPLEILETVRIAGQVADGLAAAHEQGLVHRDIKPANVLLENGLERVQITDFGLARAIDDASMTRSGVISGTPQYMSPEQAHGDAIDHRSDLFSLGSLIYFMLSGHSPFRAETTMGVLNRIGNDEPRDICSINAEVPRWLEQILMKLLAKRPSDRFGSAAEVASLLQKWQAHLQQPSKVSRPPAPRQSSAGANWAVWSPQKSFFGSQNRFAQSMLAVALLTIVATVGSIVFLETSKGTLRLETNSDSEIPIVIWQGDKAVEHIVLSKEGSTARLWAGNYVIEVEGDDAKFSIKGRNVTLMRGETWVATISQLQPAENKPSAVSRPWKPMAGESHSDSSGSFGSVDDIELPPFFCDFPPQQLASRTVAEIVQQFNDRMSTAVSDFPQPPLTVDEVICSCRWQLENSDDLPVDTRELLTAVGIGRWLPEQWSIEGGGLSLASDGGMTHVYQIQLVSNDSESKVVLRKRFLQPPKLLRSPVASSNDDLAMPLEAAVTEFNAMHPKLDGQKQPPLTVGEVIAAIVDAKRQREEYPVDNATFQQWQQIAVEHQLPKDTHFEVLPKFINQEGDRFKIWSVRIVVPQVTKPGRTYALEVRRQYISVDAPDQSRIQWGKPNEAGLQAGFRLLPSQRIYQIGQPIKTEFFYRSISGKPIKATLANIFTHQELVATANGRRLDVVENREMVVGGAVGTQVGEQPVRKQGVPLQLGYITPIPEFDFRDNHFNETNLTVEPGQTITLQYTVGDLSGGSLNTAPLTISIAEDPRRPAKQADQAPTPPRTGNANAEADPPGEQPVRPTEPLETTESSALAAHHDAQSALPWDLESGRNVRWRVPLGSVAMRAPVVDERHIYIGTNNAHGYLPRYPKDVDLGVLLCFRKSDGKFLWQHSNEKLETGRVHDWPLQGITSRPCVEGDRLWYVTNRGEVVCLDTNGFRDGQNDGPQQSEEFSDLSEADVVWRMDMMSQLGVRPHNVSTSTVAVWQDRIFVVTGNGVSETHAPPIADAPSFIALDKTTGKLLWQDNSPGQNVLHGQWGSPVVAELAGRTQVIFPGGDGWLYSFEPEGTDDGKGKLIWKFDCNPKASRWGFTPTSTRNNLLHAPTVHDGLLYIAMGRDPEHGEGPGRVWCIDPSGEGDVSPELVFGNLSGKEPIPHKRTQACVPEQGDYTSPNPNSKVVWCFQQEDVNGNGEFDAEERMSRSLSTISIKGDLLFVSDAAGFLHCLDRRTGRQHWGADLLSFTYATPLIVGDRVYQPTEDGEVYIFGCSADASVALDHGQPLHCVQFDSSLYGSMVVDADALYIAATDELISIENRVSGR